MVTKSPTLTHMAHFEGIFPQGFLVLLCPRPVLLAFTAPLPGPPLPPWSPIAYPDPLLPHLGRSVNARDGFSLGPEDRRGCVG